MKFVSSIGVDRPRLETALGIADLFTIGIGPSSSHTIGPMRASLLFARRALRQASMVVRIRCVLHGSLALTGRGHHSDRAVIAGLAGYRPETVDPVRILRLLEETNATMSLRLLGDHEIAFVPESDIVFAPVFLPEHPNGMTFLAELADGTQYSSRFLSIGGAIRDEESAAP